MNEERTGKCLRQAEHIRGHIYISHKPTWYRDTKYTIYNTYIIYVQVSGSSVKWEGHTFIYDGNKST
jgi:hypothetical protein